MEDSAANFSVSSASAELELWKNFNLEERKISLDKSCVEMREAKTASINGRRRLNDITKAFRAKPKEEQINMMTELLKSYQEEIDQLSRRSKNCETTFFSLYKALYELPDPAVTIENLIGAVMSGSTNSLEIERLRGELNQYEEEFRQLKNQDITIRRLEDALAEFKEQNEDKIVEEVNRRMVEIEAQADARIAEALDNQRTAEKRYAAAVESMKAAQLSADRAQTQLYEVSSQAERKMTALQTENGMLAEGTVKRTCYLRFDCYLLMISSCDGPTIQVLNGCLCAWQSANASCATHNKPYRTCNSRWRPERWRQTKAPPARDSAWTPHRAPKKK